MRAAADCPPFYFGGETGAIAQGDAMGHNTDAIASMGNPIAAMLYYVERDMLIVINKAHTLAQYTLVDNKPVQTYKAKLSVGKEGLHDAIWAGEGQLAIASGRAARGASRAVHPDCARFCAAIRSRSIYRLYRRYYRHAQGSSVAASRSYVCVGWRG